MFMSPFFKCTVQNNYGNYFRCPIFENILLFSNFTKAYTVASH